MRDGAPKPKYGSLIFSPAALLFIALIVIGWGLMIMPSAQLKTHQHEFVQIWPVAEYVKALTMWMIMVLAMMVPTLVPLFLKATDNRPKLWPTSRFIAGYLLAWAAFCFAAVLVQWMFRTQLLLDMHMTASSKWLAASLLIGAGAFQWTGVKSLHLKSCRLSLTRMQLGGNRQSSLLRGGINYGIDCIKCCWPMMLTMFVFGLMNIFAMGALTSIMVLEKTSANAKMLVKIIGLALIAAGVVVLFIYP
jgi:predicted metal-binding membrane protein